jgi:predicted CoA-substrate-specific enzyme activase
MAEMVEVTRIGVPRMGRYSALLKRLIEEALRDEGVESIRLELAPPITRKTVDRGTGCMDENICLPAKITLGNILDMHDAGIDTVVEWDQCGDCRQKAYWIMHSSTLRQLGVDMKIHPLSPTNVTDWLDEVLEGFPRRRSRRLVRSILRKLWASDLASMQAQARKLERATAEGTPRIGVCGEIYTVLEPAANLGILQRLKDSGAYVHNALPLSQFLFHYLLDIEGLVGRGARKKWKWAVGFAYLGMWREIGSWCLRQMERPDVDRRLYHRAKREADAYLPKERVGGHGKDSITWTIYYALAGFDSVVHILPFPCMPEATVSVLIDEVARDYGISVNHFVFDQQFGEQNVITRAEALVNMVRFRRQGVESLLETTRPGSWLGVDVGSTSTKAVLLDGETLEVVDEQYELNQRDPMSAIRSVVTAITSRNPKRPIVGGATTGSGRRLAQALLDAPLAIDEISCQAVGCMLSDRQVRSIIEIGGQDSKFISLDQRGVPSWFGMNSICSAGTGSFLTSAAREFGLAVEELGSCARSAPCAVNITGRCGVFAESDIVSKQQAGYPANGIVKGMSRALAQNFLSNVCRSRKLEAPIMFTGAVALNEGVADAFEEITGHEIRIHDDARVSGALGAAFLALSREAYGGFDVCNPDTAFASHTFQCNGCSNECEVSLIHRDGRVVCALGSRCGAHEKHCGQPIDIVVADPDLDRRYARSPASATAG